MSVLLAHICLRRPAESPRGERMREEVGARRVYLRPWRIDVARRPGIAAPVPTSVLVRAIRSALDAAGAPSPATVGLILSDDVELAELNRRVMGHKGPTDVLSFPLLPPTAFPTHEGQEPPLDSPGPAFVLPPNHRVHLGEMVVSVERAIEQAEQGRGGQTGDISWSPADELRLLVIHGTLHLCGWDHAVPEEEAAMRALEGVLLRGGRGSDRQTG